MPIFHRDSFPPGEAKGAVAGAGSIQRSPQFHLPAGRLLGDPYNGGTKPWVHTLQPTNPSEVEPRTLRASEESPLVGFLKICYTQGEKP